MELRGIFQLTVSVLVVELLWSNLRMTFELEDAEKGSRQHQVQMESNSVKHHLRSNLVCIVGNSESHTLAMRVESYWSNHYPSCWAIWGSWEYMYSENAVFLDITKDDCPWTCGIQRCINELDAHHFDCEYYLIADDDAKWTTRDHSDPSASLDAFLRAEKPLLVAFPWAYAAQKLRSIVNLCQRATVVAFDNGNFVFHRSLRPVLIPFSPSGEGGFVGNWTLPALFLNAVTPKLLGSRGRIFCGIEYRNTIQLNPKGKVKHVGGSVIVEGSRHPYEFNLNEQYRAYLSSAVNTGNWGIWSTRIEQVKEKSFLPAPLLASDYLRSVSPGHKMWHEHHFFRRCFPLRGLDHPHLSILIFGANRQAAFAARLREITEALDVLLDGSTSPSLPVTVDIICVIDPISDSFAQQHVDICRSIQSPCPIRIQRWPHRRGLRESILQAFSPCSPKHFGLFIEDDVSLSLAGIQWSADCVAQLHQIKSNLRPCGCSLYSPKWSQVLNKLWGLPRTEPIVSQEAQSWGHVWDPACWLDFRSRIRVHTEASSNLIGSFANEWPVSSSWKKSAYRYLAETGSGIVFPPLPWNSSYAVNLLLPGEHDGGRGKMSQENVDRITVGLHPVYSPSLRNGEELQSFSYLQQRCHRLGCRDQLLNAEAFSLITDTLTIVVPTRSHSSAARFISHYCRFPMISKILIVWNSNASPPPSHCREQEVIAMGNNSLNNRFLVHGFVQTEGVLSLDDDILLPETAVNSAFRIWQTYPNRSVGFPFVVRTIKCADTCSYVSTFLYHAADYEKSFCSELRQNAISSNNILLSGARMMSVRWMREYSSERYRHHRSTVDSLFNGEDLLLGFITASLSAEPDVVVDGLPPFDDMKNAHGLWQRPNHFRDRSRFVRNLSRLFGNKFTHVQPAVKKPEKPLRLTRCP